MVLFQDFDVGASLVSQTLIESNKFIVKTLGFFAGITIHDRECGVILCIERFYQEMGIMYNVTEIKEVLR